ncbi:MAG: DUF962 domain-containing protein [Nannocystis sp.]|nr:DUF962 domain-containing protein [Nannocystis sp.]MBA3548630.1 DUF962 domain-containing protein [Nannocystis sp.]
MPTTPANIDALSSFWTREFAHYLNEHRNPLNRATHMLGVPLLLVTAIVGLYQHNWTMVVVGQLVGWAFQLVGHRIEGNRPALLKRPISFLMGPLMVLVEFAELLGLHFRFARRAREAVGL